MLSDCRRLGATVTTRAAEIERSDGLLAENAFKCDTAILRVVSVISHNSIVVFLLGTPFGQEAHTFRGENQAEAFGGATSAWSSMSRSQEDCHVFANNDTRAISRPNPRDGPMMNQTSDFIIVSIRLIFGFLGLFDRRWLRRPSDEQPGVYKRRAALHTLSVMPSYPSPLLGRHDLRQHPYPRQVTPHPAK